jgi:hypothetical protein
MYLVFLPRTEPDFIPDEEFGTLRVPFIVDGLTYNDFTVRMIGNVTNGLSFFYDLTDDGVADGPVEDLGIAAAADLGTSPLSPLDHLMIEVKWPFIATKNGDDTGLDPGGSFPIRFGGSDDEGVARGGPEIIVSFNSVDKSVSMVTPAEGFRRGSSNGDATLDIADAIFTLNHLFGSGAPPSCLDAADANDDGTLDISDAIALLSHLFGGGGDLPPPFTTCGPDPTDDDLTCLSFPPLYAGRVNYQQIFPLVFGGAVTRRSVRQVV